MNIFLDLRNVKKRQDYKKKPAIENIKTFEFLLLRRK